ncbi:glutaredoxin 3 [Notoacmeibacter sp. MSK16QG-6]|uniref:glutaredoxin 3 n=1 Tax=Notoacmeibacter sp. MSK16QG-6 TaxID=2957982 RepID=UPI00209D10B2|nr:glutaredoxin 3 [Notoacmeibacter sp. MSK16QG-6]MCP1199943.1 glutaredoxin 3 [Notoacmeibacter sp. MSK16QG-6]
MPQIDIYTRQFCGYSTRAVRLLKSKGVAFTEIDITEEPQRRQEMIHRANGASTYPQVFVGERHLGGSDDIYALDRQGKLDALLKDD